MMHGTNHHYRRNGLILAALAAVLFAACQTIGGRAEPTIDQTAVIEQRLPTLQAQMTSFAGQVTDSAPTIQAIMTLVATSGVTTGEPLATGSPSPTPTTGGTGGQAAVTPTPAPPTAANSFDDVNQTTQTQAITVGQTVSGTLNSAIEAHNYTFAATAGQRITIRVTSVGGSDPRVKLVDPAGNIVGQDDDAGGGSNALLVATLQSAGTYIIRVDTWGGGGYTLSVE